MDTMNKFQPRIVVIGGGTGNYTVLSGIKRYTDNISALVNMSDDGGSTGVLRDELGVLPPGDVRQCLVALSDTRRIRDLFTYRFDQGGLKGHSFGNLFLSAVEKMTDSFEEAVSVASEVLHIHGEVIPVTLQKTVLKAKTAKGTLIEGENKIGSIALDAEYPDIFFDKPAYITTSASKAIDQADVVVISPGNLYGSLAPALIVEGMKKALKKTNAKIVCISNLVTKPGQTDGFTVATHVQEIERLIGEKGIVDFVIYNTDEPTKRTYQKYVRDNELLLPFDLDELEAASYTALGMPLIDKSPVHLDSSDEISHVRSLIRHDSDRIAREIMKIAFS